MMKNYSNVILDDETLKVIENLDAEIVKIAKRVRSNTRLVFICVVCWTVQSAVLFAMHH